MKLLLITSIISFEKEIKNILKNGNVLSYSYKKVTAYKDITQNSVEDNWFATEMNETDSILFFAFVNKDKTDDLFEAINDFNTNEKTESKIHVALLNIEKNN